MLVGRDSNIVGEVIIITLVIVLIASLIRGVANVTTGITISHAGFTPNPNVTGSPGTATILTLYPLVFVFIGLFYLAKRYADGSRGV